MFNVLFAGYDAVHGPKFFYEVPSGHGFYLVVLTNTAAEILVDDQYQQVPSGTIVVYGPEQRVSYRACENSYGNDWVRFETNVSFVVDFPAKGIPFSTSDPEYYHDLIQLITWESSFQGANSEIILSELFRVLFIKLLEDSRMIAQSHGVYEIFLLRKEIFNSPQLPWNVQSMSERIHMSEGYLQRLYKQNFGVSCMDDVIDGRIRMAKDFLQFTHKSISQIAEECGYNNVEHFCRQFHKRCNMSPGEYRKKAKEPSIPIEHEYRTVIDKSLE